MFVSPANVQRERKITDLKRGQPHLLVVTPDQVLRASLSLYMEDSSLPLPTPEEMLICNQNTTSEEVTYNYFISYSIRAYVFSFRAMYVSVPVGQFHKSWFNSKCLMKSTKVQYLRALMCASVVQWVPLNIIP